MSEVIYGAGGHARELSFQLAMQGRPTLAFIDDFNNGRLIGETPVISFDEAIDKFQVATWHAAIGDIKSRKKILFKMNELNLFTGGFISERALIAPTARIHPTVQIFANAVVSDSCVIAENVIISFGAVLEHNVYVGDNSFICPNCSIAGGVKIGSRVWVGIGSTIREGSPSRPMLIHDNALIGAASCVLESVSENDIVYGVPARSRIERAPFRAGSTHLRAE